MFSKSKLFLLTDSMPCDLGMLDVIFAFKELWGLLWESGKSAMITVWEVLLTEESPGCMRAQRSGAS